jgi:hypothetical protein
MLFCGTARPAVFDPEFRSISSTFVDDGQTVLGGEPCDKFQELTVRKTAINEQRTDG